MSKLKKNEQLLRFYWTKDMVRMWYSKDQAIQVKWNKEKIYFRCKYHLYGFKTKISVVSNGMAMSGVNP